LVFFHTLHHPNILQSFQSQILMKHGVVTKMIHEMSVARHTLETYIQAREMTSIQNVIHVCQGIAEAIKYLHDRNILHGDLKPQNILLCKDSQVQLTDFSLTTIEEKTLEIASGTLYWRAPECMLEAEYTKASDVWSFGMILLDCIYGLMFAREALRYRSNQDALRRVAEFIGEWDTEFEERFPQIVDVPMLGSSSTQYLRQRLSIMESYLDLREEDLDLLNDLVHHIFVWCPTRRYTMNQILEHPLFVKYGTNDDEKVTKPTRYGNWTSVTADQSTVVRPNTPFRISWKNRDDRMYIETQAKYFIDHLIPKEKYSQDAWLVTQVVHTTYRIMTKLKLQQSTFHTDHVILHCSQVVLFLWAHYYPKKDPFFESVLFHVLMNLDYRLFAFEVEECFERQST
jgi:serine/threonine protein kinase